MEVWIGRTRRGDAAKTPLGWGWGLSQCQYIKLQCVIRPYDTSTVQVFWLSRGGWADKKIQTRSPYEKDGAAGRERKTPPGGPMCDGVKSSGMFGKDLGWFFWQQKNEFEGEKHGETIRKTIRGHLM